MMSLSQSLSDNHVTLRAMEPEDLDVLYHIENDGSLWDAGCTNVPYSRYMLHEYISRATGDIYTDGQVRLMIENQSGAVVGIVDLVNFDARHQRAEIGIVIMSTQRRQGYATAAIRQVCRYARRMLHLHQLYAVVDRQNSASFRLFQCVGFEKTAELSSWLFDGQSYRSAYLFQCVL